MQEAHIQKISQELGITLHQVNATAALLDAEATIPFIARYRKEATGSLDEVQIGNVRDRLEQLRELDKRREAILKSIEEQGKLTPELKTQIEKCETMSVLEDLYLPYKPKRRTRATIAKEKGLEPLCDSIFEQGDIDIFELAKQFIDAEKGVNTIEEALAGARDIIAEKVNEDAVARASMRTLFEQKGAYSAKVIAGKEEEGAKYKDYFEWSEPIEKAPSHRILAMRRAEKEEIISLDLAPNEDEAIEKLEAQFVKAKNEAGEQVRLAVKDCYKRLLKSSMETEVRLSSKKRADEEAIKVFSDNLRQLLLASPLGQKNVLAIDPGIRTGCKVVCLDAQGQLLENTVIYPDRKKTEAIQIVTSLCDKYKIQAVAIGNGTAGRETETFVRAIGLPKDIMVVMVNESGASIYSASEVARDEFPDQDITVRGAVSIGRRLMDPLAELVKIDPKSIGVGQYQHDVDQSQLKKELDTVVESSVNAVGVELNTASKQLLTYVSGLGPTLAQNIIEYRNKNGAFKTRDELKKVTRLGEKAFEQCAGFLRIREAQNPLDSSAVHPESYPIVAKMAKDLNCTVQDLMQKEELRKQIKLQDYVTDKVGLPTLHDIVQELAKPGRDPREKFEAFEFADGINSIEDLQAGMKLNGLVTNLTNFGAFVDIGVHQDGLVHISQISHKRISSPSEVLKLGQKVEVTIVEVDVARKRINLTMKDDLEKAKPAERREKEQADNKKVLNQKADTKPQNKAKEEPPLEDWQSKLSALKNKFGK